MTLIDPRETLAEQSTFIGYLMGLSSLGQVVRALVAGDDSKTDRPGDVDDFVHLLLGFASLGTSIEQLAETSRDENPCEADDSAIDAAYTRWLR
ncbi:MAG TPA: hypothetical protein VGP27_28290 [Mycobacterium sp.]|jgi:hypothetical protein|nr:hypothetical protein [Mycobacterium sp.]